MIPDPVEQLESAQERVAWVHEYDPTTNTMKCAGCGGRFESLSPQYNHPASAYLCDACARFHALLDFVRQCANDTYDRVSPGMKAEAQRLFEACRK